MSEAEYQRQTNDSLRAIGRYVVEFSELISTMRRIIAQRLTWGSHPLIIGELTLGDATASQIADAFFGMCREWSKPDAMEAKIASALRKAVKLAIEKRNDVAHGDWLIGSPSEDEERIEPLAIIRYRPLRSQGIQKVEELPIRDFDELSECLIVLGERVREFGVLSLGLWADFFGERAKTRTPDLATHGVRVRDVLVWDGTEVTRTGPQADRVAQIIYFGPTTTPSS